MKSGIFSLSLSAAIVVALFAVPPAQAAYDQPPKALLDVLHAPSPPLPVTNPIGSKILLVSELQYPPMSRVAEPYLRLAGVRVEPRNHSKHDTPGGYGIRGCASDYTLVDVASKQETKIALPAGGCPDYPIWSADGTRFVFANATTDAVDLWIGDASSGSVHRLVWAAQNVYLQASPFFFADKIKLPLLIVHGEDDANPGTEPIQSRKLYQAIRGNGGTTRLVMLPHEPHWYTAMESNEQLVAEMLKWFDTYVKNAPPKAASQHAVSQHAVSQTATQ